MKPVLGIETSCDETAAAVLDEAGAILAEMVLTQRAEHLPYGGVVPEIAARAHLHYLPDLVGEALKEAGLGFGDLGGVAATAGPGLIGGLIVGDTIRPRGSRWRGICRSSRINHLEAHALTARLPGLVEGGAPFPYLLFLLSGGHSQCVAVHGRRPAIASWAERSTMPPARLSTRSRSCSAWAGLAVRRWRNWRRTGDPRALRISPADAAAARAAISASPDLKTAVVAAIARLPNGPTADPAGGRYRGELSASGGRGAGRPGRACDGR